MTRTHPSSTRRRSAQSEAGSILILTALSMVVILGIAALAIDGAYMYTERNRMAAAADAAAKSAAIEYRRSTSSDLQAFANREVAAHGFDPAGATTVTLNRPPASPSSYNADPYYVEVIVSQPTATFFARILASGWSTLTPGARAVAGTWLPTNCLITTNDLSIGNVTFTLNGCGVGVGRNLSGTNPNATVTGTPTPVVAVQGSCSGSCGGMGNLQVNQPPPVNPMAGLASPTVAGACVPATADPLPGGCYTTIPASITTLQSGGVFKVTGAVNISNLTGSNVLVYLTSTGSLVFGNNSSLTLVAGNTAPYAGIAVYGDAGSSIDGNNSATLNITGAIYMPGTDVYFKNVLTIQDTGCSLFIFNSLTIENGNGQMQTTTCPAQFSNAAYLGVSLAE